MCLKLINSDGRIYVNERMCFLNASKTVIAMKDRVFDDELLNAD